MAKWEEIRDDLFEAIIQVQPTINKEQQADVVKIMRARGHDTSWNAIRYVYYACLPEPGREPCRQQQSP